MSRQRSETTEKTERIGKDFDDSCVAIAVLWWCFRASFAHPGEGESTKFLGCVANPNRESYPAARTRPFTLLSSTINRGCQPAVAQDLCYSDRKLTIRSTWFPIGGKFVCFHQIESNSIRFIKEKKKTIQKYASLIRALRNEKNMNRRYYYMISTAVRCSVGVTGET